MGVVFSFTRAHLDALLPAAVNVTVLNWLPTTQIGWQTFFSLSDAYLMDLESLVRV